MGLFDRFKKEKTKEEITLNHSKLEAKDFSELDSFEKAEKAFEDGYLQTIYLISPIFGGAESMENVLFVPKGIRELKDKSDETVEKLLRQGQIDGYTCSAKYKVDSFIPSSLDIETTLAENIVFQETISIW